jgi:hypothetical protein
MDKRFYHLTAPESYYGRKKKFKDFFTIFLQGHFAGFGTCGVRIKLG